ncbi:MAG: hypothetical protein A2X77_05235 [Gammaproteobacteria bacterium GWE2_42_36]|nr:MAG: hypothetical protein A2X77_05235 [Gammaproteobacteria bacterium GWE2_42_36]HCU05501.1 AAA family ATPase [Coxiellaceae bacterium]
MYLDHFGIKQYPFSLTPNTDFFCNLPGHQAALNVLLFSLETGEGFIKIIGEVGSGKTLLCRKLLDLLDEKYVSAYIPIPDLLSHEFRKVFARELGLEVFDRNDQSDLNELILQQLLALREQGKRVILIVDEAQALPDDTLETIRLLTNLETESEKLVQIILLGQPELDGRLKQHRFRQLTQRITFTHQLQLLSRESLDDYLCHRLMKAGYQQAPLFKQGATNLIYKFSRGVPRIVNILAHKSMLVAYGLGNNKITEQAVLRAIKDSPEVIVKVQNRRYYFLLFSTLLLLLIALSAKILSEHGYLIHI